ncbi:MAG: Wzz/FepE/Etk N-terminal domain-containing protein [Terriglobales bacterium]|jgi:polysaccharide chain length determinant protein (PEP-CTERM system associated)
MSEARELTMEDYLAIVRRRMKVVLVPLVVAPLAGFLVSYGFTPKYTATSTVLVEGQKVPSNYVAPVITADFTQRVQTLSQQVLSANSLRPVVESLESMNLVKPGEEGKVMEQIRGNMQVTPVITSMSAAASGSGAGLSKKKPSVTDEPLPGFNVSYSDSRPERAQKICNAMTSLILDENLKSRAEVAGDTTKFLDRQVADAKNALDEQDQKLADFKKRYFGQLPGDVENNMRMLVSLNSQLDATTQNLNRAEQDKSYTESMLAQQLAAWKSSQASTSPQTLEAQLTQLQAQLLQLQARYTDDYPDVIKTKADIAKVQSRLDEINKQTATPTDTTEKANVNEPPEIRQFRLQIHQYQAVIEQSTADQKKLQASINLYQSRTAMSPTIEEQYKELTRDYDNASAFYKDLLAKKSSADVGRDMESQQEGEQMTILQTASTPDSPSFPVRPLFAAAGLAAGLGLGLIIALWLELSDKSIRTERDAAAVMDLPLLISVPWLGEEEEEESAESAGRRSFWGSGGSDAKDHEKVEV